MESKADEGQTQPVNAFGEQGHRRAVVWAAARPRPSAAGGGEAARNRIRRVGQIRGGWGRSSLGDAVLPSVLHHLMIFILAILLCHATTGRTASARLLSLLLLLVRRLLLLSLENESWIYFLTHRKGPVAPMSSAHRLASPSTTAPASYREMSSCICEYPPHPANTPHTLPSHMVHTPSCPSCSTSYTACRRSKPPTVM